jgi:hypothetical protein
MARPGETFLDFRRCDFFCGSRFSRGYSKRNKKPIRIGGQELRNSFTLEGSRFNPSLTNAIDPNWMQSDHPRKIELAAESEND